MTDHLGTVHFKNVSGYPQCGAAGGEAVWGREHVTCKACLATMKSQRDLASAPPFYATSLHDRGTPLTPMQVAQRVHAYLNVNIPVSTLSGITAAKRLDTMTSEHRIVVHPEIVDPILTRLHDLPAGPWMSLFGTTTTMSGERGGWPPLTVMGVRVAEDSALRLDVVMLRHENAI